MSSERIPDYYDDGSDYEGCQFLCDAERCLHTFSEVGSFEDVWATAKQLGWWCCKVGTKWVHFCPSCNTNSLRKHVRTRKEQGMCADDRLNKALAEIKRLRGEVEKSAALAQTVTGKFWDEYVATHCSNPADYECDCPVSRARRLGYELLKELRPGWFTPTDGDGKCVQGGAVRVDNLTFIEKAASMLQQAQGLAEQMKKFLDDARQYGEANMTSEERAIYNELEAIYNAMP